MNALRGDSRVVCELLMAEKKQKFDQRAQPLRKVGLSGNSPTISSLSAIGFPKAAFSPGRIRSNSMRSYAVSIIPREATRRKKGDAFESEEPASPTVTCIGQVRSKPVKLSSEQRRRPGIDSGEGFFLSRLLRRFLFGGRKGICAAKSGAEEVETRDPKGFDSLERIKMEDPPLPKPEFGSGASEINLWKRRLVAKPRALDLFGNGPRSFCAAKSLTP